ncbi:MAG: CpsB/CapC family capsule biosynthesis tyrosine phosphatase, partial [Planctomycetota bacterium]|nr:CpsB/CapC family capsule biosynthesis tyrosine phosphatase [Planctomycetota bacterium]
MPNPIRFVDMHCHLLPGVDDGPGDWDEALLMAQQAAADGIETVIATPHHLGAYRTNNGPAIRARTARLQEFLNQRNVGLRVLPGAEVRVEPDLVERVREGEIMTLADRGRYVLLELPHEVYLPIESLLDDLARAGLTGVLAHAERNAGIMAQPSQAESLVAAGCLLQVTAGSIMGSFGRRAEETAL